MRIRAPFNHRTRVCPIAACLLTAALVPVAHADSDGQNAPQPAKQSPDVLIFVDGEKLIGHLQVSTGKSVVFKSDMAGTVTVDWSKVKELHTSEPYAVVRKGTTLKWRKPAGNIAQGTLAVADQTITVTPTTGAPPATIPVADTSDVIDEGTFQKAVFERPGLLHDWTGSLMGGISLVTATQDIRTYTSSVNLTREVPSESWLTPINRTTLVFNSTYGLETQPGSPTVKTSIFHGDAERDQYFSPRLYVFAGVGFDHDYSQGLDLQQTYGGGLGWTAYKTPSSELDLKAEIDFENQQFLSSAQNQELLGSIFSQGFDHKFKRNVQFHEQVSFSPAWTNTRIYSAAGLASLSMPLFKRFSFTTSSQDTFLSDPSPGFRRNSFQFATGISYTLK